MLKTKAITQKTEPPLSLDDSIILKGIFANTVLLHHLNQNTAVLNGCFLDNIFQTLGYLSVSVFLFLSGYGLTVTYNIKGEKYIKGFPKNRILPFYIQNLILIGIYLIFWLIIGEKLSVRRIILSFFFGHTVIKYGWYIQTTLLLYLLFYLSHKFKNKTARIITFIGGYAFYFILCRLNNCWEMWYVSILAFATGVFYAKFYKKMHFNIIILSVCFLTLYILSNFVVLNNNLTLILKMLSCVIFPLLIVNFKKIFPCKSSFLKHISRLCFEFYVLQGLFITLFHSEIFYIKNDTLYIIIVVLSTYLFSEILNKLFLKIK